MLFTISHRGNQRSEQFKELLSNILGFRRCNSKANIQEQEQIELKESIEHTTGEIPIRVLITARV
jgi:hypothetical protein